MDKGNAETKTKHQVLYPCAYEHSLIILQQHELSCELLVASPYACPPTYFICYALYMTAAYNAQLLASVDANAQALVAAVSYNYVLCAYLEWRPRFRRFLRLMSLPSDSAALFAIVLLRKFLHRDGKEPKSFTSHVIRALHREKNSKLGTKSSDTVNGRRFVNLPSDRGRPRLASIHGTHQRGRVEVRSAARLCLR